jgi:arabinogalactan oligomer/maltooligosaccharide transport system permease protein
MRAAWLPIKRALQKVLRETATADAALAEARMRFDETMRPLPSRASPAPALLVLSSCGLFALAWAMTRLRDPAVRHELARSLPAYGWISAAVLAVLVLVILPLLSGAALAFFAGTFREAHYVGFANFIDILTARGGSLLATGSFYRSLLVTIVWTALNLAGHVTLGLVLGLALAKPWLKMRPVYRVLLVLPWAVPSYVTALVWKGMFHRQFGAINQLLVALGGEPVSWFSRFSTAFTANVLTNVWLGFPFMMVMTLGALTSIPQEVLEAAEVDGATRFQRFRCVTLPLLLPALLPSVVLGAVWTFNMFNVVYLVSGGDPDGSTDILISDAYRWAFARDAQLGYGAAYAVLIFLLLALFSRISTRIEGRAEASTP